MLDVLLKNYIDTEKSLLYNIRMKTITALQYSQKHQEKLDVYLPDCDNFTTVVYFHGGGLKVHARAKENFVEIAHSFVKKGYAFISADYRIYPEAKFPDYLVDGAERGGVHARLDDSFRGDNTPVILGTLLSVLIEKREENYERF